MLAYPRLRAAWDVLQELYQPYEVDDLQGANQPLARFADLYDSGQIPEYHYVVDTIIAWGQVFWSTTPADEPPADPSKA